MKNPWENTRFPPKNTVLPRLGLPDLVLSRRLRELRGQRVEVAPGGAADLSSVRRLHLVGKMPVSPWFHHGKWDESPGFTMENMEKFEWNWDMAWNLEFHNQGKTTPLEGKKWGLNWGFTIENGFNHVNHQELRLGWIWIGMISDIDMILLTIGYSRINIP